MEKQLNQMSSKKPIQKLYWRTAAPETIILTTHCWIHKTWNLKGTGDTQGIMKEKQNEHSLDNYAILSMMDFQAPCTQARRL